MSEHIDDQNREVAGAKGGGSGRYAECAYVQELVAGFALNALEQEDQQTVLDHISSCPPCRLAVSQAKQTAALLPFSTVITVPPLHAKAALFSRIAQSSRTANELPVPSLTLPASNAETTPAPERRWQLPRFGRPDAARPSRRYLPLLATLPLVIALALVGGFAITSQSDIDNLQAQLLSVRQDLNDTQESLDAVDDFAAQADTLVYELPGQQGSSDNGARGTVLANPGTTDAILLVSGLPDKPEDGVYDVWLESQDGYMSRVAQFGVDSKGRGAVVLRLNQPFSDFMTLHVKRQGDSVEVINTDVPPGDAIYAQIAPDLDRIFDHIGMRAE